MIFNKHRLMSDTEIETFLKHLSKCYSKEKLSVLENALVFAQRIKQQQEYRIQFLMELVDGKYRSGKDRASGLSEVSRDLPKISPGSH